MERFSVQEKKLEVILPENTMKTRVPQVEVKREIKPALPRYRNEIAKYIIFRNDDCIKCGKCAEVCPNNVHVFKPGYKYFDPNGTYISCNFLILVYGLFNQSYVLASERFNKGGKSFTLSESKSLPERHS